MRIEYQYSGEEKQIIQGQNLTHTSEEIPPPFTGGQGVGVRYTVWAEWDRLNTSPKIISKPVWGAIKGIEAFYYPAFDWQPNGAGVVRLEVDAYGQNGSPGIFFSESTISSRPPGEARIRIERYDGQPDTGGDLPTTYKFTIYEDGTEIYTSTRSEVPIISISVVDYLKFAEERLELGIDYNAVGGMGFNTTIIETGDGGQQRNANWWLPLGRWQLGDRTLLESQQDKLEEVTYLYQFHAARKGSLEGFRFKDWSDYQIINQEIGIGDGVETEWQLKKTYYAGSASCARPITKPVEGTVRIFVGYAEQLTGWSIDHTSGLIRFDNPPPISAPIQVSCEFDVPVWFESDAIGWRLEGYQESEAIYRLESVFVEEGRIPIPKPLPIQPLPDLSNEILDLGIIYDTVETIEYQTSKQKLPSGYVRRDDNYPAPITKINLGERILDREELDKLLGFFWCAKGKAVKFRLNTINGHRGVYFNNDQLNLKFEALSNEDTFYNINSLNFQDGFYNFSPTFLNNTGFSGWSGVEHINNSSFWIANDSSSKWISYIADTNNINYSEDFIYEITYNFVADRPLKRIQGRLSVDNKLLSIKLNSEIKLENVHQDFATWKYFYLYNISEGANSVVFTVQNNNSPDASNPTGIKVEWLFASI